MPFFFLATIYYLVFWVTDSLSVVFDEILYLPALTTALLNNKFVIAVLTHRNFQTSLCFSVLDRSSLGIKYNNNKKSIKKKPLPFILNKTTSLVVLVKTVVFTCLKSHSMWNFFCSAVLHSFSPG